MDTALIAVRLVQFTAAMLLFGAMGFATLVLPASQAARPSQRQNVVLVLLLALTAIAWFLLEAAEASGGWSGMLDPATLVPLATQTAFGQAWVLHLALIAAAIVALVLRFKPLALLVLAGAVLASLGLVGHAAMQEGVIGIVHRGNQMLHLLASGFWVGSLPPLGACLMRMRRPGQAGDDAVLALARFSGLGHFAVAVALLTGLINTGLILGHLPTDLGSPYQALLLAKIGLVAIMVGIALTNRYVFTPRLAAVPERARRALVTGTIAELVLGLAVLGLVSAFATFDPV